MSSLGQTMFAEAFGVQLETAWSPPRAPQPQQQPQPMPMDLDLRVDAPGWSPTAAAAAAQQPPIPLRVNAPGWRPTAAAAPAAAAAPQPPIPASERELLEGRRFVYITLHLDHGDHAQHPIGMHAAQLRQLLLDRPTGDVRLARPHFTLMGPIHLSEAAARLLEACVDVFEREVVRLFMDHLRGRPIASWGEWKVLGEKKFLALEYELFDPQVITTFRIGVYKLLARLLRTSSPGHRFGLDGVANSATVHGATGEAKWKLLHDARGALVAAVPAHSYGRQVFLPHVSICEEDELRRHSSAGTVERALQRLRGCRLPPTMLRPPLGLHGQVAARAFSPSGGKRKGKGTGGGGHGGRGKGRGGGKGKGGEGKGAGYHGGGRGGRGVGGRGLAGGQAGWRWGL
jgi:hypothetical protein